MFQNYWRAALEVFILSVVIYFILRFIRDNRGGRVLLGLVMLVLLLTLISQVFDLKAIHWLLEHFFAFIVLAILIIFQPELRGALAELGSQPLFFTRSNERALVDILVKSATALSTKKTGALIALEREVGLRDIFKEGAMIDAHLSQELLEQIFYPNSPLHDGGVVIQNDRMMSAACFFPLTQRTDLPKSVGTRHRAALGLSEETDAIVIIVSEESGNISVACMGKLHQHLSRDQFRALLTRLLVGVPRVSWWNKFQNFVRKRSP